MNYSLVDIKIHGNHEKSLNTVKMGFLNNYKIPFKSYTKGLFKDCIITDSSLLQSICFSNQYNISNCRNKSGNIIYLYSDGGSFNNGFKNPDKRAFGSYSYIVVFDDKIYFEDSICKENFTNNMSEISGVIDGLKVIESNLKSKNNQIIVVSDSQYVISGINEWRYNWKKNNWKNYDGNQISNFELWKELDILANKFDVKTLWVKGHNNSSDEVFYKYNNQCDLNCQNILKETLEREGIN